MILARNYMCSLMMISDMLSKYVGAVKSVLKKWFKINDIQLVHLLVVWCLVNLQDARCNNKDKLIGESLIQISDCLILQEFLSIHLLYKQRTSEIEKYTIRTKSEDGKIWTPSGLHIKMLKKYIREKCIHICLIGS